MSIGMQSIFRYPGGKTKKNAKEWILSYAPKDYTEYRESFVGGGGVFFGIPKTRSRWINDKDEHLISVYQALQTSPDKFIEACNSIPVYKPDKRESEFKRLKDVFSRISMDPKQDSALRYFFVNRTVFGGRVNYDKPSRVYFSKPEGWTQAIMDRLRPAADLLANTKITCDDYEKVLLSPAENLESKVWIYADPPYYKPKLKSTSLLYRLNFEKEADHKRFAECFKQSPHNVAVSYEDDESGYVRSLFKGAIIKEKEWAYVGTWSPDKSSTNTKRKGKELLILNYEPPVVKNEVKGGVEDIFLTENR